MIDQERLDTTIRSALGLSVDEDLQRISYGTTQGWDSVGHIQLVAAIEEEFGVSLGPDDVFAMSDYQAVCEVVDGRLHGSND